MWYKGLRWQAVDKVRWARLSWDGESVIYNRDSGDTHCLDAFSHRLMEVLCEHPMSGAEIESFYNELTPQSSASNSSGFLHLLFVDLTRIGLIEQISS